MSGNSDIGVWILSPAVGVAIPLFCMYGRDESLGSQVNCCVRRGHDAPTDCPRRLPASRSYCSYHRRFKSSFKQSNCALHTRSITRFRALNVYELTRLRILRRTKRKSASHEGEFWYVTPCSRVIPEKSAVPLFFVYTGNGISVVMGRSLDPISR